MPFIGRQALYAIDSLIDNIETVAGSVTSAFHNQTIRIGVTGLSEAGKTIFITSLVQNLLAGQRLPLFSPLVDGQIEAIMLVPQADETIPRFALEKHLDALTDETPSWPESTSQLSQIRLAVRYRPGNLITRSLASSKTLYLDIVDYPGEWLLDLPLLEMSYEQWCAQVKELLASEPRKSYAEKWISLCETVNSGDKFDERKIEQLSNEFRDFLLKCKSSDEKLTDLQPGRFIMPGDMAGSPALTFSPLIDCEHTSEDDTWSYKRVMKDRFEAYKKQVVKPFFENYFAKIDRQFVLVDLLGAINAGPSSVKELERTLKQVLATFRPGKLSWLSSLLLGKRISHLYFAATKSDLLPRDQHEKLQHLLQSFIRSEEERSRFVGAEVGYSTLASLKTTDAAQIKHSGETLGAVTGKVANQTEKSAFFPGDLPTDYRDLRHLKAGEFSLPAMQPPELKAVEQTGLPHMGLDKALEFLLKGAFQ
jgi:predicted YcjX-like family ATPase